MRIYIKRAVVSSDGEPGLVLKEVKEMRERVVFLEGHYKNMVEEFGRAEREREWLKVQLASGELILKDVAKLNEWTLAAERLQPQLHQLEAELEEARTSLAEKINFFNQRWVSVEANEPIR